MTKRIETQTEALEALRPFIGQSLIHNGKTKTVQDVIEVGGSQVQVFFTEGGNLSLTATKTNGFLREVKPTVPAPTVPQNKQVEILDNMTNDLYDMFRTLRANPSRENLDQAQTMVSVSGAVVNILKIKAMALKMSER